MAIGSASLLTAFGAAVRRLRLRRGDLSQEELSFLSELDRTYISGIERGNRNPTLLTMARIAKALKVSPSELLAESEKSGGRGAKKAQK